MDEIKKREFVSRMGKKRIGLFKGGPVKRQKFGVGGTVGGAAGAGIGTAIAPGVGTIIGGAAGSLLGGLFDGSGPSMPNIVDPVTGAQLTDAQGNVIASQDQLKAFADTLNGVNGVQNQQSVYTQLQGIANGTGPNPAKAQLAQATGTNVANTAALMAGQRGAASNVGLLSREAAQQGAQIQQNAAGQAATLQAEQSLGAIGQMGGIAGQQVAEQAGALGAVNSAAQNNQNSLLGAQGAYNTNITGGQGSVNTGNVATTNTLIPLVAGAAGQGLNAAGMFNAAKATPAATSSVPSIGDFTKAPGQANPSPFFARGGRVVEGPHKSHVANFLMMAKGGKVPAMVSPGEIYLSPDKVHAVIHEGADPTKIGERIPGKAKVKGDSKKNDVVARTLDEGGIVIPRHIATHKMSSEKAELFVHRAMARKAKK